MDKPIDLRAQARATWIEAYDRANEAQEAARAARDIANYRFAEYAEIVQPKFARFYRMVLNRQPPMFCQNITEGISDDQ